MQKFWTENIKPRFNYSIGPNELYGAGKFKGAFAHHTYLDNAATTKPFKRVLERIVEDFPLYGSVHRGTGRFSNVTTYRYETAREAIRQAVGASEENYVLLTKNTTEAINLAAALWKEKPGKVLVSDIEHSSNLLPWFRTQEIIQYRTKSDGTIDNEEIEANLRRDSTIKLLAVTGASNVTGYRPDIHSLAALCHRYSAKILIDACQLIPHQRVNMLPDEDSSHLDFIAFSGHKMYAPFGAGCLIGPKKFFDEARPYQIGGGNLPYITSDLEILRFNTVQTHDPGTPNVMGLIAMEESFQQRSELGEVSIAEYEEGLVQRAFGELQKKENVKLYIPQPYGNIIPFDIDGGIPAKLVARILDTEYSIGVRAGSFCTYELIRRLKGISREEDQIIALKVRDGFTASIPGIVRASFSIYNTLDDADKLVSAIEEISAKGIRFYSSQYQMEDKTGDYFPN